METRKKSINLATLGLIKPNSRPVHRSASSSTNAPSDAHPPAKRRKTITNSLPASPPNSTSKSPDTEAATTQGAQHPAPLTPQPDDDFPTLIDKATIGDDIVLGVIEQLQACGNRPMTIKELAIVLSTRLRSVQSSINPGAITASRLQNFFKRPWSDSSPCPIAKQQSTGQPRRMYYYLSTCPRQPIPVADTNPILDSSRIISPSISSGADDYERREKAVEVDEVDESHADREMFSPEPELDDLNASDYYAGHHTHTMSFNDLARQTDLYGRAYHQAASPPLEHEEREFEQTVNDMATRKASEQGATPVSNHDLPIMESTNEQMDECYLAMGDDVAAAQATGGQDEESEEMKHQRNHEAASALFGLSVDTGSHLQLTSSPMMRPTVGAKNMPPPATKMCFGSNDDDSAWNDLKSPDCVDVSEIDDLFSGT